MRFLREIDYKKQIREKNLLDIISNETFIREESETLAIREIQNYLSCKYDVEKIFAPLFTFDLATTYNSTCLLYTSPSPRDRTRSRMPSSA